MGDHAHDRMSAAAGDLFDRYLLPKIALTIILVASLVGTAVSLALSSGWDPVHVVAKWVFLVALGIVTGGLCWKHAFVRPGDVTGDTADYTAQMFDRFDRIMLAAAILLLAIAPVVLRSYVLAPVASRTLLGVGVLVVGFGILAGWTAVRPRSPVAAFRSPGGLGALAIGTGAILGVAVLEVHAGGHRGFLPVAVRALHLLAFSAWVGGAVWNIFAAVPSGQTDPTIAVIRVAGEQLERFRAVVRVVFPTILLTGFAQAVLAFGYTLDPYTSTMVGAAVASKLGLVGVLFVIFLTCPMWRACSPIDGVCDITDLDRDASKTASDPSGGVVDD